MIDEMYDSIYEFDEEGNLTHQEETTYQYDNNGDGVVDQTESYTYGYDENSNIIYQSESEPI